jgi:hypothetical protein
MVKDNGLTGQESSEGKKKYSCTLSFTSDLDGVEVCGQRHSQTDL